MNDISEVIKRIKIFCKNQGYSINGGDMFEIIKDLENIKKCNLQNVSGCWLASNSIRPTQDGLYRTIDSHGNEGITIMDTGHWIIVIGGHPVNLWFKANDR